MQPKRDIPVWVWAFLNLPFGATSGFVAVTMGFILKAQGVGDVGIAALVAMNLLPHTWKAFWAPIADTTLTRRRWYILANVASCATIAVIAFQPLTAASIPTLTTLIFINSLAITFLGMAVEGLMAHNTPPEARGRAAGWFQAGNLGGNGIGGGIGLTVAEHTNSTIGFLTIAGLLGACTLALWLVPDAPPESYEGSIGRRIWLATKGVAKDVWGVIASRRGIVALVLCFLPIGSGAASGLFGAMGERWGASGDLVALTAGTLGGFISAGGCIVGGAFSDRMNRAVAYALSGAFVAVVGVGMALFPRSEWTFGFFTLTYNFTVGIAYACFTAFVLEVIGKGAAATKYNAFASLSNIPILYMTIMCGWASEKHGASAMLLVDAGSEVAGIVILLAVIAIVRPGRTPVPAGLATEVAQETDR